MRCVTDIAREMRLQRRIVAHRGLHHDLPENSAEAFRAAWAAGFGASECDVHASADGAAVVIHDETLERTTTGQGRVCDFPWSVLRNFRLRGAAGEPTWYRIPLLREVLDDVPRNGRLLIEIKPPDAPQLVRQAVRMFGRWRARLLISFDPTNLRLAAELGPTTMLGLLADQPADVHTGGVHTYLFDHTKTTDEAIAPYRQDCKGFGFWTVNEDADILRVLALDPDWLISNRPDRVRELQDLWTDQRPKS